ncbi:biopolymer transporter ExbD [uncultured Microscilla sp.]|uniref:ExbD/TolR family protein n=1 Tax=uncultured Microscilla sp. TaxID=432653 RepID=UPI0026345E1D|nr:biopolymer transporter ExbD [uncultured Microscilla sp.]
MSKFGKKEKAQPAISTASLPDIVFMLLFFFMVTTVMRETDVLVEQSLPQATQLTKLEDASLVSYIYVGKPKDFRKYGKQPLVQVNDVFVIATTKKQFQRTIVKFVEQERSKLKEYQRNKMTVSLKVDRKAKMGIISDVKLSLREADARKVNYAASMGVE